MKKPTLESLTLRQKIGQTGMPSPNARWYGVHDYGDHGKYFKEYPFAGIYIGGKISKQFIGEDTEFEATPEGYCKAMIAASEECGLPLLVTCDAEHGAKNLFEAYHRICTQMSVGAAGDNELAYQRNYYFARELKSLGVNWAFGPVCDLVRNFFASTVRDLSDNKDMVLKLLPDIIRGYHDAGIACTAKHYPGAKGDYRDSHISSTTNKQTVEDWYETFFPIWKKAIESGADSIMVGHTAFPAMDPSYARGKAPRPACTSKKMIDVLRNELHFNGVIVTDAVNMKGAASVFDHEDVYIECFNAGNDIVLFCHNDYIDVMEKAVLDGRVSIDQINASCQRVLDLKEKLGLFNDDRKPAEPLTAEENKAFDATNYEIAKKAITLIRNEENLIPLPADKVKKAAILNISSDKDFLTDLQEMVKAFERRGVEVTLVEQMEKGQLEEFSETQDVIVYACAIPEGSSCHDEYLRRALFYGLSSGAEKSVVASFGTPTTYYNYFESVDTYLNAYSSDAGTMRAFVDGILGDFPFTGKSPVELEPRFQP